MVNNVEEPTHYVIRRAISEGDLGLIAHMNELTIGVNIHDINVGAWWIVWDGADYAGFCGINPPVHAGRPAYLVRAGVLPEHRGQGLQKRLIEVRLRYAKKMGWSEAVTYTLCNNAPSANSLIAKGFKVYIPKVPWASDKDNVIYWKKVL